MSPDDLERAATSLGTDFRSSKITIASVLAGYLRRAHLRTSGDAYTLARAAVDSGHSFEEAVRIAGETLGVEVGSELGSSYVSGRRQGTSADPAEADDFLGDRTGDRDPRPLLTSTPELPDGARTSQGAAFESEGRSMIVATGSSGGRLSSNMPPMDWFPKAFGPGDIDGSGALKLLGNPRVSLVDLLVRETAQNSWDARSDDDLVLQYRLHLRTLSPTQRTILSEQVFTEGIEHVGLGDSLAKPALRVLEVHDRGTSGLDGPCRNDRPIAEGVPTNFIDLVLNVGSPPDKPVGGGTYGFGKTVSYLATHSGVVLFWTHVRAGGSIESRLIASGFGDRYDQDGRRFTGRHWWGVRRGQVILPLTGAAADELAHALFSESFDPGQTGTSMMLIDPKIESDDGVEDEGAFIGNVRNAILLNLWPKLVGSMARRRMLIELLLEDKRVEIPDPRQTRFLVPFVDALEAVRDKQDGREATNDFSPVSIIDIRSGHPDRLVGRLGLVREPATAIPLDVGLGPTSHHVCFMRHDAELVVKYKEYAALDTDGFQWAGVFKPESDLDPVFARSEPPAHDDWVSKHLQRPDSTFVNKAISGTKEGVKQFLDPTWVLKGDDDEAPSVASLSDRLSGLVGSIVGNRPLGRRSGKSRGGPRRSRPKVEILDSQVIEMDGRWRYTAVEVLLSKASRSAAQVRATAAIAMENHQREIDQSLVSVVGWSSDPSLSRTSGLDRQLLRAGESKWLMIRARRDLAIDVKVGVVEE